MRVAGACLAVTLLALGLAACVPVKEPSSPPIITATPALFPGFQTNVSDYVVRCDPNTPTDVQVDAPAGTTVSVNGSPAATGQFSVPVTQDVGQAFTIDVTDGGGTTTHHVRCLPTNFPNWAVEKNGPTQADFYATVLDQGFGTPAYSVVFDSNGVPVWWLPPHPTFLLQPFSNGNLAIMPLNGGMEEYSLDGTKVKSLNTVGGGADFHDVVLLPNGNYVMATVQPIPCVLTSWGLDPTPKSCLDHVFQELTPQGVPVWTWDTNAHIPVSETAPEWIVEQLNDVKNGVYDPWHYNAIEPSPSGQHDTRLLPDGTVTMFDNGTLGLGPSRQPRDVRYIIDTQAKTATLAGALTDPDVTSSGCCGSARLLPGGDIVTGWGGTPQISEHAPDGTRVFHIGGTFVYRATPILPGEFTAQQFRDGMDAQFAAGLSTQAAAAPANLNPALAATIASEQCCLKR